MITSKIGKIPWGLLGTFALVYCVELSFAKCERTRESTTEIWKIQAMMDGSVRDSDVLCFGDSLIHFGVMPPLMEKESGRKARSLALAGGSPESSYYMLRKAINAGARPRSIVVDFMPYQLASLEHIDGFRLHRWAEILSIGEMLDFAFQKRNLTLGTTILLDKIFPSIRIRDEIRSCVISDLKSKSRGDQDFRVKLTRHNMKVNRGALLLPESKRAELLPVVAFPDYSIIPEPGKLFYVRRFLSLAESKGIEVLLVVPPISPEFQDFSVAMGTDFRYTEYLKALSKSHKNVTVIDARNYSLRWNDFHDSLHMARGAASEFSLDLADAITRQRSDTRWISLAHVARLEAKDTAVLDIDESSVFVRGSDPN